MFYYQTIFHTVKRFVHQRGNRSIPGEEGSSPLTVLATRAKQALLLGVETAFAEVRGLSLLLMTGEPPSS